MSNGKSWNDGRILWTLRRLYPTIVHASEYRFFDKKKWPFDAKKEPRFLLHSRFSFLSLLPIKEVNTRSPTVSRAEHVCTKLLLGWYRIARYTLLRMKEAGG